MPRPQPTWGTDIPGTRGAAVFRYRLQLGCRVLSPTGAIGLPKRVSGTAFVNAHTLATRTGALTNGMSTLPQTMRALELSGYDGLESLAVVEKPVPTPGPRQVLVKVEAAPVNPSDLMFMRGRYGFTRPLPTVPGFEGSGRVVAGEGGYARALLGRRVACGVQKQGDGLWAEYVLADARACLPLLPNVSFDEGAGLLVNPLTAVALVERAGRGRHRAVVQTAAGSALGRMVARLAERRGIGVVDVVRRAEQADELRAAGGAHVLCSGDADFEEQLKGVCKDLEATLAFDAVAGDLTGRLLQAMPHGSTVVVYGALSEAAVSASSGALIFQNKRVESFWLSDYLGSLSLPGLARRAVEVQRLLKGDLQVEVRLRVGLEEAVAAIREYEQ